MQAETNVSHNDKYRLNNSRQKINKHIANFIMIKKIISGGQTGVDQAALTAAIECHVAHGGWCPRGRLAENGSIPSQYQLTQTQSSDYDVRTRLNIEDSDGTLVLLPSHTKKITDGTLLTMQYAQQKNKPLLVIDLSIEARIDKVIHWVQKNHIAVLNIAGPRESQSPGIYQDSLNFLKKIIPDLILHTDKTQDHLCAAKL